LKVFVVPNVLSLTPLHQFSAAFQNNASGLRILGLLAQKGSSLEASGEGDLMG
jgi:hypothetical protein